LPTSISEPQVADSSQTAGLVWQPYTPATLAQLRQANKPVFVNFTAAWCITCQVNERVAFQQAKTIAAFQAKGVTPLKADWTNRNPAITKALESFGRSGVPLYVLYPSSSGAEPIILPQLLSPQTIQEAIENL